MTRFSSCRNWISPSVTQHSEPNSTIPSHWRRSNCLRNLVLVDVIQPQFLVSIQLSLSEKSWNCPGLGIQSSPARIQHILWRRIISPCFLCWKLRGFGDRRVGSLSSMHLDEYQTPTHGIFDNCNMSCFRHSITVCLHMLWSSTCVLIIAIDLFAAAPHDTMLLPLVLCMLISVSLLMT